MTVGELRDMLNELGEHMPVKLLDPEGNVYEIKDEIKLFRGEFMIEAMPQDDVEE